jgi:hypothetical protein
VKLSATSVFILVKKDLTLLLESELKAVNSSVLVEEDDCLFKLIAMRDGVGCWYNTINRMFFEL